MKIVSSVVLTASLVLSAYSAEAAATAVNAKLLDLSAKSIVSEQWSRGALASQKVLATHTATTWETMTALNNLCIEQTKLSQFSDAMATCDKSVALGPDQWANYMNRGNLRAMIGNVRGAAADYARAKELNPTHPATLTASTMKPVTPSFIALAAGEVPGVQRADVGQ